MTKVFASLAFVLLLTISAAAQGQAKGVPDEAVDPFWESVERSRPAAAAQLVLSRNPITALVMRSRGLDLFVWGELGFVGDVAPKLDRDWLNDVVDNRPIPQIAGRDKIPRESMAFANLFSQALANGFNTPLDAFKKSGEENHYVTFGHMYASPDRYRGEVVKVTGTMLMLRRYDEVPTDAQRAGVGRIYQGWIFGATTNANPFMVYFPLLPEGLKEAEKMREPVTFYGYFIAKVKYGSGEGDRITPMLIGPTVILNRPKGPDAPNVAPAFALVVLWIVVGTVGFMVVMTLIVNLWLRRGDERIRTQMLEIHNKYNPPVFEDEPKVSPIQAFPIAPKPDADSPPASSAPKS